MIHKNNSPHFYERNAIRTLPICGFINSPHIGQKYFSFRLAVETLIMPKNGWVFFRIALKLMVVFVFLLLFLFNIPQI